MTLPLASPNELRIHSERQPNVIIDALMDAGLNIEKAEDKLDEDFFDELNEMGLHELASHMKQLGFYGAQARQKSGPASIKTHWELPAESLLEAWFVDEGEQWYLVLVHFNAYGPVDGVTVEVRIDDDDGAPDSGRCSIAGRRPSIAMAGWYLEPKCPTRLSKKRLGRRATTPSVTPGPYRRAFRYG